MADGAQEVELRAVTTLPRVRVNSKQNSKGEWYFEATTESDMHQTTEVVQTLSEAVEKLEAELIAKGRKLASS